MSVAFESKMQDMFDKKLLKTSVRINGRPVGTLYTRDGEPVEYVRNNVKLSKHLLRIKDAWGIQEEILDKYLGDDTIITIIEREEGVRYQATKQDFVEHGEWMNFSKRDGNQIFLARQYFKTKFL